MNIKNGDDALRDVTGGKFQFEEEQFGKYEIVNDSGDKCEFEEGQFGKYEVDIGTGGKYEVKAMHRNKNYCPECGKRYSSERDAFCPQCGHPREVEKTW